MLLFYQCMWHDYTSSHFDVFLTECNRAVIEAGYVLDDHLSASTEEIDAPAYRGRKNLVLGN